MRTSKTSYHTENIYIPNCLAVFLSFPIITTIPYLDEEIIYVIFSFDTFLYISYIYSVRKDSCLSRRLTFMSNWMDMPWAYNLKDMWPVLACTRCGTSPLFAAVQSRSRRIPWPPSSQHILSRRAAHTASVQLSVQTSCSAREAPHIPVLLNEVLEAFKPVNLRVW